MLLASAHLWLGYHSAARCRQPAAIDLHLLALLSVVRQLAAAEQQERVRDLQLQEQIVAGEGLEVEATEARVAQLLHDSVYDLTNQYFQVRAITIMLQGRCVPA
jgi:hypothetical protein